MQQRCTDAVMHVLLAVVCCIMELSDLDSLENLGLAFASGDHRHVDDAHRPGGWLDDLAALADALPDAAEGRDGFDVADLNSLAELGRRRQPPQPKPPPARRSHDALAHAREAKRHKAETAKDDAKRKDKLALQSQVDRVHLCAPAIARACGLARFGPLAMTRGTMLSDERARFLLAAAFERGKIPRGLGVTQSRLQFFVADLLAQAQQMSLASLLKRCALFRRGAPPNELHVVTLNLSWESDATCQQLAQHVIQTLREAFEAAFAHRGSQPTRLASPLCIAR
jgi:hypothetical protein